MFHVYVLRNAQDKFYVGQTDDIERRITQHNDPHADHTKFAPKNGPWELVWLEEHPDRSSAMLRERQIKAMKSARWIRENLLEDIR